MTTTKYDPKAPRPSLWKFRDPFDHERRHPFLMQKAQAVFRGELWNITFEEWCSFWTKENWDNRGRDSANFCMSRLDAKGAWEVSNVQIITRKQHLKNAIIAPDRPRRGPGKKNKVKV